MTDYAVLVPLTGAPEVRADIAGTEIHVPECEFRSGWPWVRERVYKVAKLVLIERDNGDNTMIRIFSEVTPNDWRRTEL